MTTITTSLRELCREHSIHIELRSKGTVTLRKGPEGNGERYTFTVDGNSTKAAALVQLAARALTCRGNGGFDKWATANGRNPDSRKAEADYRAASECHARLRAAFGGGLDALLDLVADTGPFVAYRQPATLADFDPPSNDWGSIRWNVPEALAMVNQALDDYKAHRAVACACHRGRYKCYHTAAMVLAAIYHKLDGKIPVAAH